MLRKGLDLDCIHCLAAELLCFLTTMGQALNGAVCKDQGVQIVDLKLHDQH